MTTSEQDDGERTTAETVDSTTTSTTESETDSESTTPEKLDPAPDAYRSVPVPSMPGTHEYATMGAEDAPVTARVYGAWKCPHTRDFVLEFLPTLIQEYVKPGDVAIEFRAVAYEDGEGFHGPDEPRAARGGVAVWNEDPDSYWTYFGTVFENQNSAPGWATTENIVRMAKVADVSHLPRITSQVESGKYQSQIERTMDQVREIPIPAVPRVVVGDTVTAPTIRPKKTKRQLDAALGRGSGSDSTTTTNSGTTATTTGSGTTTNTTTTTGTTNPGTTTKTTSTTTTSTDSEG